VVVESFENPRQVKTGRRGYLAKRASVSLSEQRRKLEPFAEVIMRA
jgi:hypothetical protein